MRRSTLKFALLGLAVAPAAWSIPVTLADTTVKLDVGVMMQNRAEMNWSETSTGADFDANRGKAWTADPIDFYNRRTRLNISAEREGWKGLLTFAADKNDSTGYNLNRGASILYLWAQKTITTGEFAHVITVGLDQPAEQAAYRDPSSQLLFPVPRATVMYPTAANAYGVRYQLNHKFFQVAVDVQNNRDASRTAVSSTDGLFYGARAVASLLPGVALPKRTESFVGEKGLGLALGIDGTLDDSYATAGSPKDVISSSYTGGADVLFHLDEITADVDARFQQNIKPGAHQLGYVVTAQAGYAVPVAALGIVVEPALRGAIIDKDVDDKFTDLVNAANPPKSYSSSAIAEHGNSGYEAEAGLNIYLKGHSNKVQIGFQHWESENSDANANILRIQHQFSF